LNVFQGKRATIFAYLVGIPRFDSWHTLCTFRPATEGPSENEDLVISSTLWGIIVAGGAEERRRAARGASRHSPVASPATRSVLFRRTLDRATRLIPPERLTAVLVRDHSAYYDIALGGFPGVDRLVQPRWRGSAPEIFLPVLRIARRDPDATVVVLPGDQFIDGEASFMHYVAKAARAVAVRPDLPVVIGAHPGGPQGGSAWIEPGPPVEGVEAFAVRAIARFLPRPSPADVVSLWDGDGLVHTGVIVAKARTLIGLGSRYLPDVLETFEPLERMFGAPEERLMCEAVYEDMPYAAISHALFARVQNVGVLPIAQVLRTSDTGVPVAEALAS
jgi:mannose-1-phosphate guanylyltransferase